MHVAVDANVLIADPRLESQVLRVLLDYLARTRSRLILLEPVEMEVKAHFRRQVQKSVAAVESALNASARQGLQGLPELDGSHIVERSVRAWSDRFRAVLDPAVERVPVDVTVLPEALRRATERTPPCSADGKELRDTVIWLNLLSFVTNLPSEAEVAFISQNVSDFAGLDKKSLRRELHDDVARTGRKIFYFPSLDAFIKAHAERIGHVTVDWVRERLDLAELQLEVQGFLENESPERMFRVADSDFRDYYEPSIVELVYPPDLSITDIFVWKVGEEHVEIRIECAVYAEAEIECQRVASPFRLPYGDDYPDDWRRARSFSCFAEVKVTLAAAIRDDRISIVSVEDVDLA